MPGSCLILPARSVLAGAPTRAEEPARRDPRDRERELPRDRSSDAGAGSDVPRERWRDHASPVAGAVLRVPDVEPAARGPRLHSMNGWEGRGGWRCQASAASLLTM